jgi:hypothetical protein
MATANACSREKNSMNFLEEKLPQNKEAGYMNCCLPVEQTAASCQHSPVRITARNIATPPSESQLTD